ncbi:TP53-regulated inhibitor of apoptosis 1 [Boothiomyces sp. JEL0866]|nr:TP53-regulated inhibitor of apoptosis 1 [Boothiomyces sp. JEL0866]
MSNSSVESSATLDDAYLLLDLPNTKKQEMDDLLKAAKLLVKIPVEEQNETAPECNDLKKEYDECFNKWYAEKFLKGDISGGCETLFKKYKACVWVEIKLT